VTERKVNIMKAVRVNEYNKPVDIENIATPAPGAEQVLVKVRASGVNPVDRGFVAGWMDAFVPAPLTLGADFAGDVVAVGSNVTHVKAGDAVYGMSPSYGTYAEYVAVNSNGVALKPRSLDYVSAAAVPLAGLTAWQTLFKLARLERGERILIHGAGGGIGAFAVQLAKNAGAYVIAHDRGDKEAFVRGLGADEFINADTQRFEDAVGNVDVVLDLVGGDYIRRSFSICGPGARYVTPAGQPPQAEAEERGIFASGTFTQPTVAELTALAEAIDAGKLTVHVARTFPLDDIHTALAYKAEKPGKVVVTTG